MKKIINGKMFNTETAEKLGSWDNGFSGRDFQCCSESLYRTKKGVYFLAGEGGPMSKYAEPTGNSISSGSGIEVIIEEEARQWAEEKLSAAEYEKVFGKVEEA